MLKRGNFGSTDVVGLADKLVAEGGGLLGNQQLEEVLSAALQQEKSRKREKPSLLEISLRKRHCEALDGYKHPMCVSMACLSWLELEKIDTEAAEMCRRLAE